MKKKTVVLHRVSTDGQDFESQDNAIQEYVINNNIIVDEYITEHGVSGYRNKLYDREAIQKIEEMAIKEELDTLIVFNLDRIGRTTEGTEFLKQMTYFNVKVISVTEGVLNQGNDTDELINSIKFWMAQQESKKISIRSKNGLAAINKRGEFAGGAINYGYTLVDRKLEVIKEEADIIRLVFDMYLKKGTNHTINYLRENNITKRGTEFSRRNIFSMLKNPIYIGKKMYGVSVKISNDPTIETRKRDISQANFQPYNEDLRIVSDDVFYEVQERMSHRRTTDGKQTKYSNRTTALFEGLLYHRCGDGEIRKLHMDFKTDVNGERIAQYRCGYCKVKGYKNVRKNFGGKKLQGLIEEMILEEVANTPIAELEIKAKENKNNTLNILENSIKQIKLDISKKGKALNSAKNEIELIFMGESSMNKEVVNNIILKVEKELIELRKSLTESELKLEESKSKVKLDSKLIDKYTNFCYAYSKANEEEKKLLLQELIDRVIIINDEINIQFYSL